MSRYSVAKMTHDRWVERELAEHGGPLTPATDQWLWDIAYDFSDQMKADAEGERGDYDPDEGPERDLAAEPDDYPGDEAFA